MARRVGGRARPAPKPLSTPKCPFLPPQSPLCPSFYSSMLLSLPVTAPPRLCVSWVFSTPTPFTPSFSLCLPPGFRCLRPTLGLGVGHLTGLLDKGLSFGPRERRDWSPEGREGWRQTWQEVRTPSSGFLMSNREQVNSLQGTREVHQEAKEE